MKTSHCRTVGLFLALISLLLGLAAPIHAAAQTAGTANLITLEETTNLVVIIRYQSLEPDVAFLSPSGEQYSEALGNLQVERGDLALYCHLPQAQPGTWQIIYDKKTAQELTIDFVREASSIVLTELSAESTGTDGAQLTFQADFPEDVLFHYTIYAAVVDEDGQVSGQRELISSTGRTNQPVQVRVSFRSLATYDRYRLMVEVWLEDGGIEVSDTALFPETFSYENPSAPNAMDNVALRVDLENQGLVCDWSRWRVYGDGYLLAVFQNDEAEPYFFQEYEGDITQAEVLIDPEATSLRVDLTYRRGNTMSRTLSRTIDMSQSAWLSIATPEQTNSAQARVDYRLSAPLTATVTVNEQESQLPLEGEGFFAVNLQDGVNRLSVAWSPEEELTFVASREISCDRTPPMLRLFETDGTVRTFADTFLLAGQAELGCALRIDGQEVHPEEDGTFLHELALSPGDNQFEVELTDPAGNRTVQQLNIHRATIGAVQEEEDGPTVLSFLPLILTVVGSLLLVILGLLLFRKGKDGKRRVAFTMAVLLWVLAALSAIAGGLCAFQYFVLSRRVNSSAFLEMAQNSLSQAYEQLQSYQFFGRLAMYAGIAALALGVLALLFTLISRHTSKSKKPKAAKPPKKPKPPKGGTPPAPPNNKE